VFPLGSLADAKKCCGGLSQALGALPRQNQLIYLKARAKASVSAAQLLCLVSNTLRGDGIVHFRFIL
jgi:hypothetical protein